MVSLAMTVLTGHTEGSFKASMALIGLTGQIWGAFIVSEFMTGRVKSSRMASSNATVWKFTHNLLSCD